MPSVGNGYVRVIQCETYGAEPSASSVDRTRWGALNGTAIAAALADAASGGTVTIDEPGTYYLTTAQAIPSNCTITLGNGVILDASYMSTPCFTATSKSNIRICGDGKILCVAASVPSFTTCIGLDVSVRIEDASGTRMVPANMRSAVGVGTEVVGNTIVLYSGARLTGAPGKSILRQSNSVNKCLLMNSALVDAIAGIRTAVTIAWTAGVVATVTWTAHGKTVADYVCFQGATQGAYNSIFPVHRVVDANSFEIVCQYSPGASGTGTIYGYRCDTDIHIDGITLDYNVASNASAAQGPDRHACVLGFIARSSVRNFTAKNVYKYGFNTVADRDCTYENISGYGVAEIFKHYGPSVNCDVNGIFGSSTDDCTTLQAREPAAFIAYQTAYGDIWNRSIRNVDVSSDTLGAGAVVIYASDSELFEGVSIADVSCHATDGSGVAVKYGDTFSTGKVNTLRLENIRPSTATASIYFAISVAANVDLLEIVCARPKNQDYATALFKQESTSTIRSLIVRGLYFSNSSWINGSASYVWNLNGNVDSAVFEGGYLSMHATGGRFMSLGSGTIRNVTFNGVVVDTASQFLIQQAGASIVRRITLNGCRLKSVATGFDLRSLCKIILNGNDFDTMSSGVVRPTTTAGLMAQIYGSGNTFTSAAQVAAANSATWEAYSFDLLQDPISATNLASTVGQFLTSSQASTEGGPAVLTPAGWVALGTGAAGINTVIT